VVLLVLEEVLVGGGLLWRPRSSARGAIAVVVFSEALALVARTFCRLGPWRR